MLKLIWLNNNTANEKYLYKNNSRKCILFVNERLKGIDRWIYSKSTIKPCYLGHVDYLFDDKVIEPISNVSRLPSSKTRRIETSSIGRI